MMLMVIAGIAFSQTSLNGKADNIVGTYLGEQKGDVFKARITKTSDGTKIYDPQRGFTAKMSAEFIDEGTLRITGTVMGLSGHFTWKKI